MRLLRIAVVSHLLPFVTGIPIARAEPSLTFPPPAAANRPDSTDTKSPVIATGLALLGTTAGWLSLAAAGQADRPAPALMVAGLTGIVVGPSLGHFYAGEIGRGLGHAGVRLGASALFESGMIIIYGDCLSDLGGNKDLCESPAPLLLVGGGAILLAGATIWSIIDASHAARRTNRARRDSAMIAPTLIAGPDRSTGYGLSLAGTF